MAGDERLDERIERYLDGELAVEEVAALERGLLEPAAAQALSEALLLRELLGEVGPAEPPAGLVEDIVAATAADGGTGGRRAAAAEGEAARGRWTQSRAARAGVSALAAGSALAFAGMVAGAPALTAVGKAGGNALLNGLRNARLALGPLAPQPENAEDKPKRSVGRAILRWLVARERDSR